MDTERKRKTVLTLKSVQGGLEYKAQKQMEMNRFMICWLGKNGPQKKISKLKLPPWKIPTFYKNIEHSNAIHKEKI